MKSIQVISRLASVLFATTNTRTTMTSMTTTTTTTTTTTPTTTSLSSSLTDLSLSYSKANEELLHAPIYKDSTSTIRFSFVTPPNMTVAAVPSAMNNDNDNNDDITTSSIFEMVSSTYSSLPSSSSDDHHHPTNTTSETTTKPLMVYLPGLDCVGVSASQQFHDLSNTFELWRMTISTTDRTSHRDLITTIVDFIDELTKPTTTTTTTTTTDSNINTTTTNRRRIVLVGESFGGQLAPLVALQLQQPDRNIPLQGLVLVNPATSFQDTNWEQLGPLLAAIGGFQPTVNANITPYTVLGGMALSSLVPDATQLRSIASSILSATITTLTTTTTTTTTTEQSSSSSSSKITGVVDTLATTMQNGFGSLGKLLPPQLVNHRVTNWLTVGSKLLTDDILAKITTPTLIVVGDEDKFLPSKQEADRLTRIIPTSQKFVVKGAGHFVLDARVNLTEAIVYSSIIDPLGLKKIPYDPILDWKLPEPEELNKFIESSVNPLRRLTSPVFFSTNKNGRRFKGLGQLPSEGPIVFVSNHQLLGLDLGLIIAQLIEDRGIVARGLAHPTVFSNNNDRLPGQPEAPGLTTKPASANLMGPSTFTKFGAVKVSPRNYYRLLQTGQNVLLFPGGVREVFHGKKEAYQLFWPDTPDFIRTAARFNATIVPISAVGAADSVEILMDAPDLIKLPFVGKTLQERSANTTSARFDKTNDDELFLPPLIIPKLPPARQYFCFGKPFVTTNIHPKNLDQCETLYRNVKTELERGFEDILRSRTIDPYYPNNELQRVAYEQVTGKTAPTFPTEEMNQSY